MFSKNKNGCYDCDNCPMTNDTRAKRYCHLWWEMVISSDSGEQKIEKGCGHRLLPVLIIEAIKSADHSVAASYDMRNKVVDAFTKYLGSTPQGQLPQADEPKQLEQKEETDE